MSRMIAWGSSRETNEEGQEVIRHAMLSMIGNDSEFVAMIDALELAVEGRPLQFRHRTALRGLRETLCDATELVEVGEQK